MNTAAIMHALSTPPDAAWSIPVRTTTESNSKGHWRPKANRAKAQRAAAMLATRAYFRALAKPQAVRLTRVAPGTMDTDNLASAGKHVRDGIADALGTDDSVKAGIEWMYAQEKGARGEYAVRVEVWL